MAPQELLKLIRQLADGGEGLFRIHRTHGGIYARARRQFGSWAAAVAAAGVDYRRAVASARKRATITRQQRRSRNSK
jgi:hypothetical protein